MGKVLDGADRAQRRFPPLSVPLAVIYKYFDDQGSYLAAIISFYAFVAIFPLLLLATSIFGFILQGRPDLEATVISSTLAQFPIIGDQLGRPEGLTGSTAGVVIGTLTALYGSMGLGQALQNAMNIAWSVPRNSRPNPFLLRLKSLILLMTAGLAVVAISVTSALISSTAVFGAQADNHLGWLVRLGTVLVQGMVLTVLFRLAASRRHHLGRAAPGGFAVAIMWQGLQWIGTMYVTRVLVGTSAMNQTFGLVLGLMGLIYIAAVMGVLGMQINVVLAQRLWPRALLTPFTDRVDLTEADRRAYTAYAQAQRHKGFEQVEVVFAEPPHRRPEPEPEEEPEPEPEQEPEAPSLDGQIDETTDASSRAPTPQHTEPEPTVPFQVAPRDPS